MSLTVAQIIKDLLPSCLRVHDGLCRSLLLDSLTDHHSTQTSALSSSLDTWNVALEVVGVS